MIKKSMPLLLCISLLTGCGTHSVTTSPDEAFKQLRSALRKVEEPTQKIPLIKDFLESYPDGEHTADLADALAYYQGEAMKDPEGAFTEIKNLRAKVQTPKTRFQLGVILFPLAQKTGQEMNLRGIAEDLEKTQPLDFDQNIEIADLAISAREWKTALEYSEQALSLNPESASAEEDSSQEDSREERNHRLVRALSNQGWAQANLGDVAAAKLSFQRASEKNSTNYLGVSQSPLDLYQGQFLLQQSRPEEALRILTPKALYGADADARDAYRKAWEAIHSDGSDFESALWENRLAHARVIDNFKLKDYRGASFEMEALRGKTVLLSFWFPT